MYRFAAGDRVASRKTGALAEVLSWSADAGVEVVVIDTGEVLRVKAGALEGPLDRYLRRAPVPRGRAAWQRPDG